ncbi:hypothetical protein OUZ56_018300 [Daphnia magna]|uniref:Uncharacterized protein n=1 Tax=Daphnia magna TaxID=35525 RepID=A0ABQ9Z8J2_9CRUS|nr:hypothetical protein OUZ56_018300 [Daphnia magna]
MVPCPPVDEDEGTLLTHDSFQPTPNGETFRTLEHQMLIGFEVLMADWFGEGRTSNTEVENFLGCWGLLGLGVQEKGTVLPVQCTQFRREPLT